MIPRIKERLNTLSGSLQSLTSVILMMLKKILAMKNTLHDLAKI